MLLRLWTLHAQLERDGARLNDLLGELEARARARPAARTGEAGTGTLTTADIGKLDWPVDGPIIYSFGPQRLPSGVCPPQRHRHRRRARHPGEDGGGGDVELLQNLGTYGLTVIIAHGNGYRSIYTNLGEARVQLGGLVTRGQVIGTVGGENTDEGAHLYFEIRGDRGIALDPADWLKRRR